MGGVKERKGSSCVRMRKTDEGDKVDKREEDKMNSDGSDCGA